MMATTNNRYGMELDSRFLDEALTLLAFRLKENGAVPSELVVCGGSALILTGMVSRTTSDVDIVAFMRDGSLCSPDPLPEELEKAAGEVAEDLGLPPYWLNNGPSRDPGGLFQFGLPDGLAGRLAPRHYGSHLTVYFIHRIDQIHFKLYAAVDRGGYHVDDLQALNPDLNELEDAARWAMTHDVSEGFALVLKDMLRKLGYEDVAEKL